MKYIFLLVIASSLVRCNSIIPKSDKKGIEISETKEKLTTDHFNITISSDLSNRLNPAVYPKALSDVEIVNIIGESIYPKILNHKRSMNQLDHFRVDFINKKQINAYSVDTKILDIDFSKFKQQSQRIQYLRHSFTTSKRQFLEEFQRIHNKAVVSSYGSDIWTYLQQGIDNSIVDTTTCIGNTGNIAFVNRYRNILILLTDGYVEAGIYNKGYDISGNKVHHFRQLFLKSGEPNIEQFFKKNQNLQVNAATNPLLKDLEILVLELYDRTDTNSGASVHPTDLEIMKLLWADWLNRSKIKKYELHAKFSSKAEAEKIILKFLGV